MMSLILVKTINELMDKRLVGAEHSQQFWERLIAAKESVFADANLFEPLFEPIYVQVMCAFGKLDLEQARRELSSLGSDAFGPFDLVAPVARSASTNGVETMVTPVMLKEILDRGNYQRFKTLYPDVNITADQFEWWAKSQKEVGASGIIFLTACLSVHPAAKKTNSQDRRVDLVTEEARRCVLDLREQGAVPDDQLNMVLALVLETFAKFADVPSKLVYEKVGVA